MTAFAHLWAWDTLKKLGNMPDTRTQHSAEFNVVEQSASNQELKMANDTLSFYSLNSSLFVRKNLWQVHTGLPHLDLLITKYMYVCVYVIARMQRD